MVLDDIAQILIDAGMTLPIFRGGFPPDYPSLLNGTMIALIEVPGALTQHTHDGQSSRLECPRLEIVVRGTAYNSVRRISQTCWRVLEGTVNYPGDGRRYLSVKTQQSPYFKSNDDYGRVSVGFSVDIVYAQS